MRIPYYFILIFLLIFIMLQCSEQDSISEEKPPPVSFMPGVPDTSVIERGIDAVPDGHAIQLQWITSTDEFVIGYEIFRSQEKSGSFQLIADGSVLHKQDSLFIDTIDSTLINIRLYYCILSINDNDIRSDPSDTLSYMLIQKADNLFPQGSISDQKPVFMWEDPNRPQKDAYVIRLLRADTEEIIWLARIQSNYSSDQQTAVFNEDGTAGTDSLETGREFIWRVDILGSEDASGSESQWYLFSFK